MSSLRVLLVENDPQECERISLMLEDAHHDVFPLGALPDAAEALDLQRFDAVLVSTNLVGSQADDGELQVLAAKLRRLEETSRLESHVPILACGPGIAERKSIEAYLPPKFEAASFSDAVQRLAQKLSASAPAHQAPGDIFDSAEFQEQVCFDRELMVEIIDLYLEESAGQVTEMRSLLAAGDLPKLSRVAHTIKGSLSSLHAPRARQFAQDLELSAKAADGPASTAAFASLEFELAALAPELLRFRNS